MSCGGRWGACSHNRDACAPIFVVNHAWNARYVRVSVWAARAGGVYVVIVPAAGGRSSAVMFVTRIFNG